MFSEVDNQVPFSLKSQFHFPYHEEEATTIKLPLLEKGKKRKKETCAVIRFHASGFYLCAAWTRESLCGSDQSKHDLASTGVLCFHLKYLAPQSREEGLSLPSVLLSLAADLARQMMDKRVLGASSVFQRSDRKEVGRGLAEDLRGDLTLGKSSAELEASENHV